MSGLSLRTIQRLEAGHRVSYASLRALAATLEIDVDSLERELYAVNRSTEDFVEIPRWVRLLDGRRWFGGPGLSRRDVHLIEAFCVACAVGTTAAPSHMAKQNRGVRLFIRGGDTGYSDYLLAGVLAAFGGCPVLGSLI
jgi:hypothetical protein